MEVKLYYKHRDGVAMIELIFAIVIIGIVLLPAPQLVSTSANSGFVATQQEAISEAASRVNTILGYSWDESNTDYTYIPTVLNVSNGNGGLDQNVTTGKRNGTPPESYRSFLRADGQQFNASLVLGPDGGDLDDMDDFNGNISLVDMNTSNSDYIDKTVQIATAVTYGSDGIAAGLYIDSNGGNTIVHNTNFAAAAAASTNIKLITVTLTNTNGTEELNKTIVLHAFSCNIGGYDLEERTF